MASKNKISVRKILQVTLTITVTICCIVAMVSASKIEDNAKLKSVAVHIRNDKKYHFIEQKEITDLVINSHNIDIENMPLSRLDIHTMQQELIADPWIASAEVYIDNDRVLHIYVTQRVPVARVFQQNSASYYLDTTMSVMPLSKNYVYYTTVVTNVPEIKNDSEGLAMKKQIVSLSRTIQADSFWNAQVAEIIVDSDRTFELTPVLGDHRILFGDASGMKEKFSNLFVFYKDVLNRIGWDKYETLDLRFNGQVIASPSLPYKGPVDKAVVNMNWINSMVEVSEPGQVADSVKPVEPTPKPAPVASDKAKVPGKNTKIIAKPLAKAAAKSVAKKVEKGKLAARPNNRHVPARVVKKATHDKDKKVVKSKGKDHNDKSAKDKKNKNIKENSTKDKNAKQAPPKYVYPDKK